MTDQDKIELLRAALLRLVGAETPADLDEIETGLKMLESTVPAEDFAVSMGAIQALRATA